MTILRSARSTDAPLLVSERLAASAAGPPMRRTRRRGRDGSSRAGPRVRASPSGVWRAARNPQGLHATEAPPPSCGGGRKARLPRLPFLSDRQTPGGVPKGAPSQGGCKPATASSLKPRRCVPKGHASRTGQLRKGCHRATWTVGHPKGCQEARSSRHHKRWQAVDPESTVAKQLRSLRYDAGAAEVDALVSTPLRPGRSGPGSGRLQRRCALPQGRGRDLDRVRLAHGPGEDASSSRPARQGLRDGSAAHKAVVRGFNMVPH